MSSANLLNDGRETENNTSTWAEMSWKYPPAFRQGHPSVLQAPMILSCNLVCYKRNQDTAVVFVINLYYSESFLGEIDLEMLSHLHAKHPDAKVDNEVVEPSDDMVYKYKCTNPGSG